MEKLVQKTSLLLTTFLTLMVGLPLAASAADHPPVITWYQAQDDPAPRALPQTPMPALSAWKPISLLEICAVSTY